MPVRKITEQQFRTRRKDRRMVWVDCVAFVVGLLILTVSVGGIIVVEPPPEPVLWEYSFPEKRESQSWGMGFNCFNEGCDQVFPPRNPMHLEGDTHRVPMHELTLANVSQVVFTLAWTDDVPDTSPQGDERGKTYVYDENSTDIFRMEVFAPWGESFGPFEAANDLELKSGTIQIVVNVTDAPAPGTMEAFDRVDVGAFLSARHTVTDHRGLGVWEVEITMVRAGDQVGTFPRDLCEDRPGYELLPEEVAERCYINEEMNNREESLLLPVVPGYYSTYHDRGNRWLLDFTARSWESSITF